MKRLADVRTQAVRHRKISVILAVMLAPAGIISTTAIGADTYATPTVSTGRWDTLLLRSDGSLWSCSNSGDYTGFDADGNLIGTGYPLSELPAGSASWISAGRYHGFANDLGAGLNQYGQLGVDPNVLYNQVGFVSFPPISGHPVAGSAVTYFIAEDGTIMAAGANSFGELGDPSLDPSVVPYTFEFGTVKKADGEPLTGIRSVAAGSASAIAVDEDGKVWTWGDNSYGQLGDGTLTSRNFAAPVDGLHNIVAVSANTGRYKPIEDDRQSPVHDHVLALSANGTIWAWGENRDGETGNGTLGVPVPFPYTVSDAVTRPVKVLIAPERPLTRVIAIAAGGTHSLALLRNGTVWSWGYNGSGQLGDGTYHEGVSVDANGTPVNSFARRVPGVKHISSIAAGPAESFAVKQNGTVWSWGWNYNETLCQGLAAAPEDGGDPSNFVLSPTRIRNGDGTPFNLGVTAGP